MILRRKNCGMKCAPINTCADVISMCVVLVNLQHGDSGEVLETSALLDSCIQGTFVLERLLTNLVIGRKASITIKALNRQVTSKKMVINGLHVASGSNGSVDWLQLPCIYTKKYLPVDKDDIVTPSKLMQWKHLNEIIDKISEDDHIS